ncbi:MAG: tRNA (cytidine(56)-2'-O)-methyltransferase [Candidatus Altiarchaeales archaeon]|nr:tRNA (cytidine(56)-2'-O)-methyltransferase [Candidatus Altiarchaeales archaeon]
MKVVILRLGHRYARDKRLSSHVALTARAFGASEIVFDAVDSGVKQSVERLNELWGNGFRVSFTDSWRKFVEGFEGDVVHLTMYGLPLSKVVGKIGKSRRDKLVIVGSQKVPSEVYHLADFNVSVGCQPHSEVAALAVFLDRLFDGKELLKNFKGRKVIVPQAVGKKVVDIN